MKTVALIVSTSLLAGCAFTPPEAYPIFKPDAAAFALFKANVAFDDDVNKGMLAGLRVQRAAYQEQADHALRGVYNQSDWTTGGAAVGIAGGLVQNVATAVTGAVIGGGAAVVGSRYRQSEQIAIYRNAANKTDCLLEVASDSMSSEYYSLADLPTVQEAYRRPITRGANYAVMDVLAGLRNQLDTLTPASADFQAVLTQITQYRALTTQSKKADDAALKFRTPGSEIHAATLTDNTPAGNARAAAALAALAAAAAADAALTVADFQACAKTGKPVPKELATAAR